MSGRVEVLMVSLESGDEPTILESVEAITGRGLAGDRYLLDEPGPHSGDNITLIEREAYEHLAAEGLAVEEPLLRRNLVVTGIDLNDLVGRDFMIGAVQCRGSELCHPCHYIESLTHPGVLKALVMRGGLRAEIVSGGIINVGDEIVPSPPS
ncbi:MAG: MOSC domain-containing protein [Actinomycetes bacterium]